MIVSTEMIYLHYYKTITMSKDPIVQKVVKKYDDRSEAGIKKYNTMLTRKDLSFNEWLIHLQEELMDATLYIETLLNQKNNNDARK